jgi:transposase
MMGEQVERQARLLYEFCLDDVVPGDHLLRRIDGVVDLSWLRRELSPFYGHTGCPSVDPELLIRMMLIDYCYSIRSDRRLIPRLKPYPNWAANVQSPRHRTEAERNVRCT